MKLFKKKKNYGYYFQYNGELQRVDADSMQEAVDIIFWQWFLRGAKHTIIYESGNDPNGLIGDHELKHNRKFFQPRIKVELITN